MGKRKLLYIQIMESIKERMSKGELMPYQQLPTEMMLAEEFGVSRITSKRALVELEKEGLIYREKGKGSFVKPDKFLGDQARASLASASPGMGNTISMVMPVDFMDENPYSYIVGATDYLMAEGFSLNIHIYQGDMEQAGQFIRELPKSGIKGMIYYPTNVNDHLDILSMLYAYRYPIISIDKYLPIPIGYVVSDNMDGTRQAIHHLVAKGHKKIGYVSGQGLDISTSGRERYMGYCEGMRENGLNVDSDHVIIDLGKLAVGEVDKEQRYKEEISRLLQNGVTAIQAVNDKVAVNLLRTCVNLGIKVPEDMAIIGFDNLDVSRHLDVPLTSVSQDFVGIGRKAAEFVLNMIRQGHAEQQKHILPVQLIKRKSG